MWKITSLLFDLMGTSTKSKTLVSLRAKRNNLAFLKGFWAIASSLGSSQWQRNNF